MTNKDIEQRLWDIANDLRANSGLGAAEYSHPVLGLIFLRHADFNFTKKKDELKTTNSNSRRKVSKLDYQADGVVYLPEYSQFEYLLNLPESANIGETIDNAMQLIEDENSELKDILPRGYTKFSNDLLVTLLKAFSKISTDSEGDVFGKIYEYFLGKFAMSEGQKGGEFFTPTSIVKLIVEIIEPFHGKILDPACGSGGMFVQSARFVQEHKKNPSEELSVYGCEKTFATVKLCKMNLAVHGLSGDVRENNSYYEDVHKSVGKFDFVMANPPFNVKKVDYEKIKNDLRCPLKLSAKDNANYLWIQFFHSALNNKGRAGFIMANTASDATGNELEIRKKLILSNGIDVIISVGPNFFYTVTLPCTIWFLDKNKEKTDRKNHILFIDARKIFHQVDRSHREFDLKQIEKISDIVRSYRKEKNQSPYKDVPGLCKMVSFKKIESEGWSLNAGVYIDAIKHKKPIDFTKKLNELTQELEILNKESDKTEKVISNNLQKILGEVKK
jgi:type I restriction enzyme M protein